MIASDCCITCRTKKILVATVADSAYRPRYLMPSRMRKGRLLSAERACSLKGTLSRVRSVAPASRVAIKQAIDATRIIAAVMSDIMENASVSGTPIVSRA